MASELDERSTSWSEQVEVDSDELLQAVLDSAPLLMMVTDLQGTITHWRGMSIDEVGPDEALGQSMLAILDHLSVFRDGQVVDRRSILQRVVAGKTTFYTVVGDTLSLAVRTLPVFADSGEVAGMLAIAEDVSQRREAEKELAFKSELLARVVEAAPVAIDSLDVDGRVQLWNSAAEDLFGWSSEEVLGGPPPGVSDKALAKIQDEIRHAREFSGESVRRKRRDGTKLELSLSSAPLTDSDGELIGRVGIFVDETGKKAEAAAQRQSQKMEAVGRLAGAVAHDFNNLLSVILGFAELVQGDLAEGDRSRSDIGEIILAAERAERLTDQLLTFSKKRPGNRQVLDLGEYTDGMRPMLERLVGEDVVVRTHGDEAPAPINVDPGHLEQVMLNLVINAREAMPDGGKITVSTSLLSGDGCPGELCRSEDGCVLLVVRDNGQGMSRETREKLFEPFFTTKEQGTGIGMSTVYGILKQHGADIEVDSEVGRGTEVRVYFPVADERPGDLIESTSTPSTGVLRPRTGEILVVDDERAVREYVEKVLERRGYLVTTAPNAGEALMMCEEHPERYEFVLTDVVMPRVDGLRLRKRLESVCPGLIVAFMSGYPGASNDGDVDRDFLLDKPFAPDELVNFVDSHLESAQNVRE
jgi:PAS domain S-box-containing protein